MADFHDSATDCTKLTLVSIYQEKIDGEIAHDPLALFIKDFRNYLLHFSLPATLSTHTLYQMEGTNQANVKTTINLHKESLLDFPRWSPESKKYILSLPDTPTLLDIIEPYYKKIFDFQNWLYNYVQVSEAHELEWLKEKKRLLRIALEEPE